MPERSQPGQPGRRVRVVVTRAAICAAAALSLLALSLLAPAGAAAQGSQTVSAPTSPASTSPAPGVLKYYIVGPPIDGRPEYLFDIAVRTLGTGRRYLEIFSLNEGRTQPDGDRLQDPAVLHPGWVLILPPDAAGPAVHTGPLPTRAAGGDLPSATRSVGGTGAPAGPVVDEELLSRLVVFVFVASIIVVALWLLRRGQRLSLPVRRGRSRPRVGQPALAAGPATPRSDPPRDAGVRPPAVAVERGPEVAVSTKVGGSGLAAQPVSPRVSSGPVLAAEVPASHESLLEAEITLAPWGDSAAVRLAGIRLQQAQPGWMWLDPDAARPASPTVVALGSGGGGALCVDVAQAPDVLTVAGHLSGSRRLAASIARQLTDAGVAVTVVGTSVGAGMTGVRTVPTLAEAAEIHPSTEPYVVFCGATEDGHTAAIRQLTIRSKPRTVVVLVGPDRRSRWSIQVRPPRVDH